jgi:hypothetical protein
VEAVKRLNQPNFFDQQGYVDIGKVGVGVSGAHYIACLGKGSLGYYVAKQYDPQKPWTLVSEWICADIASLLGLPIPARKIIPFNGKWLGFELRSEAKSFEPGMEQNIINCEVIAGMIAFDVWICNRDRNPGNVLLQRPSDGMQKYTLSLIDHSHALIGDLPNLDALRQFIERNNDPRCFVRPTPHQLRSVVCRMGEYMKPLMKIESFDIGQLAQVIQRIPTEWIPNQEHLVDLVKFVGERATEVKSLIMDNKQLFVSPTSQGG